MLRYAGREIEGTSPWEVGVGDFKTLIIILRDRAEAEIIFLRPRTSWPFSRPAATSIENPPRSNPMVSHILARGPRAGSPGPDGQPFVVA